MQETKKNAVFLIVLSVIFILPASDLFAKSLPDEFDRGFIIEKELDCVSHYTGSFDWDNTCVQQYALVRDYKPVERISPSIDERIEDVIQLPLLDEESGQFNIGEFSGFIAVENSIFFQEPAFEGQDSDWVNASLVVQPEYYRNWEDKHISLTFTPFYRLDSIDRERTHADVRELFLQTYTDNWELSLGVREVFWGVTESQHLVDIINQTDLIENVDGEDKLGQPMVNLSLFWDWGTLDFFAMPYFRERTFPGKEGRYRKSLVVDSKQATFDSSDEEKNLDWAVRWSHVIGNFDVGVSHFSGTSRDPRVSVGTDGSGNPILIPHYDLIDQTGLDLQYTKGSWLWKLEALHRSGQEEPYNAAVGGFEYTFFNVWQKGFDSGLLAEYNYDDRGKDGLTSYDNDLFLGTRLAFNDTQDTKFLVGIIKDMDFSSSILFFEGSRRLTDNWTVEAESRLYNDIEEGDSLRDIRKDDYVRVELRYYF